MKLSKAFSPPAPTNTSEAAAPPAKSELYGSIVKVAKQYRFDDTTARLIAAMAAHETGNFTSYLYKSNNNLFGMHYTTARETTATKEKNGYAYYPSLATSIKDLKLWFKYLNLPTEYVSPEQLVKTLKENHYFTAPEAEYLKAVKWFYNYYQE